jgi:hypothetical protein
MGTDGNCERMEGAEGMETVMAKQSTEMEVFAGVRFRNGEVTITKRRYSQFLVAEQEREAMRVELKGYREREAGLVRLMRADWQREFAEQNRLLLESGEEPVTALEFVQCRLEDAEAKLAAIEALPAKWRALQPKPSMDPGVYQRRCVFEQLTTMLETALKS